MRIWKIAAIAALGLTSFAADNVAPTKAELEEMYNTAYRAFDAGKFPEALKQLDAIDARQPDLSTGANAQNAPEINNRVTIAGPAKVRISPVLGARLFITYRKERDAGSGGSGGGGGTPIPVFSATPGVTPSPTFIPLPSPTPTP